MNIEQAYQKVNAIKPAGAVTPLTLPEAAKALKKMYRHLRGAGAKFDYTVTETTGNRDSWAYGKEFRVNVANGWDDLIHLFSHWFHYRFVTGRPHSKTHARIERRLRKWAVERGWLNGSLKVEEKPEIPVTPDQERAKRIERRRAQVARLERKIKALTTRLRNAKRSLQGLERHAARKAKVS